jgi:glycosyltransferase involved in cell wall biosynthesis
MKGALGALVSCVVPVYNGERFVRETLDTVVGQTYRPIEVLVVDDGSTDGTAAVAGSYGDAVRVIAHGPSGPAGARNRGWLEARGEFVAFLDQDDLWHPRKLALQMARFAARPELECSIAHVQMFWDDPHTAEARHYQEHPRMRPVAGYATTTMLVRRSMFERVGPLNPELRFADSPEWFVRAEEQGVVVELLPDVLTYHRLHAANLTRRHARESAEEFVDLVKFVLDRKRARRSHV